MTRQVVITGLGPVTSIGIGKKDFFNNILAHKVNIRHIPEIFETNYKYQSRYYSVLPEFSLSDYGFSSRYEKIMQEEDKISILGTILALRDAGFSIRQCDKRFKVENISDCGVILGIGISSLETIINSYLAHIFDPGEDGLKIIQNNDIRYNRMIIPMTMPNSISAWNSILFNLKGCSYTINAACASGTIAIGEAYQKIRNGYSNIILSGGVECLKEQFGSIMRGFDVLGTLTKSDHGLPIPFSERRSGFLFSEGGGCILVMEELEHALKRGARIYAEIIDYKINSDAHNIIQMEKSGSQVKILLKDLKGERVIDYLNSHGTGTVANDEIEAKAIIEIFGDKEFQPCINSTKGIIGHTIGASGAIEAAVTALSIKNGKLHGNLIPEPMENLNLITETIDKQINFAISTSYGFGGHNAGILFKKFNSSQENETANLVYPVPNLLWCCG